MTEHVSLQTTQADVCKVASLVYEPGATKLSFFFNSGPKKVLSLSLNVKGDPQTHKKNDASNYGINLKISSYKVPIIIFRCYIMGDEPIIIQQFFFSNGFKGVIMGSIMGSQNIMGSDYGRRVSTTA